MKNKKLQNEINKLVERSFMNGKADEKFIAKVIATLKKLSLAESLETLQLYQKGLKRKIEENTLVVESAVKLSSTELKMIEKMIKREVIAVEQKINSSLLGGLRIKIGDEFLDFSLKSKINQVTNRIKG
jgi:F-type H+-transporting ATPase subunit delta